MDFKSPQICIDYYSFGHVSQKAGLGSLGDKKFSLCKTDHMADDKFGYCILVDTQEF
jgi:hypothetical protein